MPAAPSHRRPRLFVRNHTAPLHQEDWRTWSAVLHASPDLTGRVIDLDQLCALLAPFLGSDTRRKPRSLATKALHFGAPKALIPADTYAVNVLGKALGAGSWDHTDGLGIDGRARWHESYLKVIHEIGQANAESLRT